MIVEITSCAPTVALRTPAIPAYAAAASVAGHDREQDVRQRVHAREGDADPVRDDQADEVLALAADVEHPAAEREGNGEAGEDERRRLQQRLGEVVREHMSSAGSSSGWAIQFRPVAVEDLLEGEERRVDAVLRSRRRPGR